MKEFSKADKKTARIIIDLAIQRDFNRILNEYHELLIKWKIEESADNRLTYGSLYEAVKENDKYVAKRYDGLSGSKYYMTIVGLLIDGIVSEEDLVGFSAEAKEDLLKTAELFKSR